MRIWRMYEIPLLVTAFVNMMMIFIFSYEPIYHGFWMIVAYFSLQVFLQSFFLSLGVYKSPRTYFSMFVVGKLFKFITTLLLFVIMEELRIADFADYSITIIMLYLSTMFVDNLLCLRFLDYIERRYFYQNYCF